MKNRFRTAWSKLLRHSGESRNPAASQAHRRKLSRPWTPAFAGVTEGRHHRHLFSATSILATFIALFAVPAAAQKIAVTGGTVHTMGPDGVVENGTVLIDDGRIRSVRAGGSVPSGYEAIDAAGKIVTPGLFAALTSLGAVEVGAVDSSRDSAVSDEAPFSAAFDISWGINPRATAIPVTRIEGITRAGVAPGGGRDIFSGYGALIHLGDAADIVTHRRAFQLASLGAQGGSRVGGARGAAVVYFVNAIGDARRYAELRDKADYEGMVLERLDAEALGPVVRGEAKLLVRADRASDITQILRLKREIPALDIAIAGAAEGWMVADDLATAGVPVIVDPFRNLPGNFSTLASTQHNAARLVAAGVEVVIGDSGGQPRLVTQLAGNAVANGLDHAAALAAITINPARLFGVADEMGSLERGKVGDLVVWDGDPLEVMSSPDVVLIEGRRIDLVSRQTRLRDRYMELGGELPPAYRR